MSDPESSSFDPPPSRPKTPIPGNKEKILIDSKRIKPRCSRPAPASMKRKREQAALNIELLKMCKPLSIKLDRIPQQVITKMLKKCEHTIRTKKKNRWQKGFVDKKTRKRTKSEKPSEKSSEVNQRPNSPPMTSPHSWGCCRMIPFDRNKSRNHRRFSISKNKDSIVPERSQQEIPNDRISEPSTSKMALRDRQLSLEDKRSIIKAKEVEVPKNIPHNPEPPTSVSLPAREKKSSISKEESPSKPEEDEFVCRRVIPYIRKTPYNSIFNPQINDTSQAGGSKNSIPPETPIPDQDQTLKESKTKSSKSSKREKRSSVTEKEYSGCSKTQPFIFKNRPRDRGKIFQQAIINSKSEVCEKPSELESKVCEKTDETKAPEPNASKESDNDEIMEENFTWNNSSMWKLKRKNKSRRISSSSDESPMKKTKNSTLDRSRSGERKRESSFSHEKAKSSTHSGIRTLCPPSCTNTEHHSNIFNFLYKKPKVIPLKEVHVVLERLEDMANDPYVIRWMNNRIKVEKEEVEDEDETDLEESEEDQRYYLMYEDGTVSNEALPQEAIYQINEMSNFQNGGPGQVYDKVNSYEGQLSNNSPIDMSRYFNDECLPKENNVHQADLPKDDGLADGTLRDDVPLDDYHTADVVLEFNEYPKVLLIRLETLVGTLDSEYFSSEIETLEEKYIDFMMNSNFSYDKQSQSFFDVYKRLHAKRAKDRKMDFLKGYSPDLSAYMDGDTSEASDTDETDSRDDYIDEKPLVIALDAEREEITVEDWATDESSNNSISAELHVSEKSPACEKSMCSSTDPDSEIATITPLAKNAREKVPLDNNSDATSIEFVTCNRINEKETSEDPFYITCKFCKVSFRSLHSFALHKTDCHLRYKKPLKCEYCNHQYKNRRTLKLHIQHVHGQGDSLDKNGKTNDTTKTGPSTVAKQTSSTSSKVTSNNTNAKASSSSTVPKKRSVPAAQQNLRCGVCAVIFETREILWDHVYKHTERELQDAFEDATKTRKNEELRNKIQKLDERKKDTQNKVKKKKHPDPRNDSREWANKYALWKDRILYKNSGNGAEKVGSTSQNSVENQTEEIILSSGSEECRRNNKESDNLEINSSTSRSSVIKNTKSARETQRESIKTVTMCPCHSNDTSTMVNGDMQIEMVLLCEICQVLFRRRDCFEVHYRVNKLCNMDRTSRLPKLFCSCCRIILNSLPEMRHHLEKHAEVNRQGHVTFLCNICKVMFFGVGSLFYSHWFNHNKDVNFLASRYSFPKLSIVPIMSLTEKIGGQNQKEEYLFVAEYVCKDCKIPFGSEADLENHVCRKASASENNDPKETQPEPKQNIVVRVYCVPCKQMYANKKEYDSHEAAHNHSNSIKAQYICVATTPDQKAYICTQCRTVRMSVDDLKEHWIFHRPWREKYSCANCPDVYSKKFNEIEGHIKRCRKNPLAVCNISLVAANYKCQPCHLHFENNNEWKEHYQMCSRVTSFASYAEHPNMEVVTSIPSALPSATSAIESSVPASVSSTTIPQTIPSAVLTAVATPISSPATASNSNNSLVSILPKPTAANLLEKYLMLGTASKKKPTNKRDSQDVEVIDILSESSSRSSIAELFRDSNSVENAEVSKDMPALTSKEAQSAVQEENLYDSYTSGKLQSEYRRKDVSLSKAVVCYPPKRKQKLIPRSENSPTKRSENSPTKRSENSTTKRSENSPTKSPTSNLSKQTPTDDAEKSNVAMTAVNPEFETLLTELEDLGCTEETSKKSSKQLRNIRRKSSSKESSSKTSANDANAEDLNEEGLISETGSLSIVSEATSSKYAEKETLSPLPFEVVLLPEDENDGSPKPGALVENSITQVDINSNKSAAVQNSASGQIIESDQTMRSDQSIGSDQNTVDKSDQSTNSKGSSIEQNTASIIEEYIEYIMMDEAGSDNSTNQAKDTTITISELIKEAPPQIEKVAPTRLRVRSLAELQEIKMHLCDTCGQSFDSKKNFDEHKTAKCSSKSKTKGFHQSPMNYSGPPQNRNPDSGITTEVDYEAALTQNLVRRGASSPNMDFIPPLVPLSMHNMNATSSRSNMTSVPPNLAIPDVRRRQHSGPSFGNQSSDAIQSSSSGFSSPSHAPRSAAIQLPERTGGSGLQKRPSGAATRIQNLSRPPRYQTPSVIQHRGLPQTYMHRNSGRLSNSLGSSSRPSQSYTSSGSVPIRPALEKPNSLTCTACTNFTAKSLSEFSSHLLMHFMETSANGDQASQMVNDNDLRNNFLPGNQESQQIDPASRNSPNTSGYQNSQIAASDIYGARSSSTVAGVGSWQTPAKYIYACQLCNFRTETKASIRLHEKNHMAVTAMKQKNLQRLQNQIQSQQMQNQQMMQEVFQVQQQQQRQFQVSSALPQLMDQHKPTQVTKPNPDTSADKSPVILYTRVSSDIYQCQLCNNFFFSTQDEFMRHLQSAHKQIRKEPVAEPVSDNGTVCFVCDYCETPQIFETEVSLRKHMNFLHNHLCHICSQRCTSREILQSHLLSHKLDNQAQ